MNIFTLKKINDWATQWKVSFIPDQTKQVHEVIFSRKIKKPLQSPINKLLSKTSRFDLA